MITDARVLQPDFVPRDVVHRDAEISHLSSALRPITDGDPGESAILYGPSGAGKTCVSQFTVDQLREEVIDLNTQYVNCWEHYSAYKTLYRVLEGIGKTIDIHRQSTPRDELLDRIKHYDGPQYVVVLDEVDQLQETDVLYELYRTRSITMVLIANREEELFSQLGDRLTSRIQTCARISFDVYSLSELVAILEDRVRWGLRPDVIDAAQLEWIADAAAGDARVAISILRAAARRATDTDHEQITDVILEEAVSEGKLEVTQTTIERLTPDQRVLYTIISEAGEIAPQDLYEAYNDRAEDPKSDRTVRTHLQKLAHYDLIEAVGENRGRTYRTVDSQIE